MYSKWKSVLILLGRLEGYPGGKAVLTPEAASPAG
jgi:hypothetical protein